MNLYHAYKYDSLLCKTASDDHKFYKDRLLKDIGMTVGLGVGSTIGGAATLPLALKGYPKLALGLGAASIGARLGSIGYGLRGGYDAYKAYSTRPEKTASALETFVATIR